jgi:cell division septum initiation protein DivIVA
MKPKELENENERLKKELAELRSAKTVKVVEPEKAVDEKKEVVKPVVVAKPKATVMTTRQKMRMLKGL